MCTARNTLYNDRERQGSVTLDLRCECVFVYSCKIVMTIVSVFVYSCKIVMTSVSVFVYSCKIVMTSVSVSLYTDVK